MRMNTTPGLTLAGHQRLYRTFLLAYPRAFRGLVPLAIAEHR